MPTAFSSECGFPYWELNDPNWHVPFATLVQTLSSVLGQCAVSLVRDTSRNPVPFSVQVNAGSVVTRAGAVVAVATTGVTVTASATTLIWVLESGVVGSGAAWPTGVNFARLASVVADVAGVTAITDLRFAPVCVVG